MQHFYNTIGLNTQELRVEILKAQTQEEKIKAIFNKCEGDLTPYEVWHVGGFDCPLTSVRRAITNLTKQGFLKQTGNQRAGKYGKLNWTWKKS